jgi:hypothetical protein
MMHLQDQKRRIAKRKTFTGCWSCRASKVKCDLTRPECLRCTRTPGKKCKGYDVSLTWVNASSAHQPPTAIKRQAMSISPVIYTDIFDSSEIDAAVAWLETCEPDSQSGTTLSGPFGVFPVSFIVPDNHVTPIRRNGTTAENLDMSSFTAEGQPHGSPKPTLEVSQTRQHRSITYNNALAETTSHSSGMESLTTLPVACKALQTSHASLPNASSPHFHSVARGNPLAQLLLRHYTEHIATLLQPVSRPNNTYKSIHAPVALKALDALCNIAGNPHSSVAASRVAVLFSLLATSAVHMRSANGIGSKDLFHQLRHEAYSNLSMALEDAPTWSVSINSLHEKAILHNLENTMSASLTLVTLDVSSICNSHQQHGANH